MIKWIVIIIILVLAISYFGIDLRGIVNSPAGQSNLSFVQELAVNAWQAYAIPAWEFAKGLVFDKYPQI